MRQLLDTLVSPRDAKPSATGIGQWDEGRQRGIRGPSTGRFGWDSTLGVALCRPVGSRPAAALAGRAGRESFVVLRLCVGGWFSGGENEESPDLSVGAFFGSGGRA